MLLGVATLHVPFFVVCLNLGIAEDPAPETRVKVAYITEPLLALVHRKLGFCCRFHETVNRYKQHWATSILENIKKKLETEHKAVMRCPAAV